MRMLQIHAHAIFYDPRGTYDVIVFILKRFRPSTRCVTFKSVLDENAQSISVEGMPQHSEINTFSNENELFWTGP